MKPPTLHNEAPNLVTITIGELEIAYSYGTPVGFYSPLFAKHGWVLSENVYSGTTGKHIAKLPGGDDKKRRVERAQFETMLAKATNHLFTCEGMDS